MCIYFKAQRQERAIDEINLSTMNPYPTSLTFVEWKYNCSEVESVLDSSKKNYTSHLIHIQATTLDIKIDKDFMNYFWYKHW